MVYYFRSAVVNPPVVRFMGKNKHENEDRIKWGFPEDVIIRNKQKIRN